MVLCTIYISKQSCTYVHFAGDLELNTVQSIIGKKYCFTISAIADEEVEPKESVSLHIYSNDSSVIYSISSTTTIVINDNNGI